MYEYECKFCNKKYFFEKSQQIGSHITNCKLNPKREDNYSKISKALKGRKSHWHEKKNEYFLSCKKCNQSYSVICTENIFLQKKYKKFCSRKCSNSRSWDEEQKNKISISAKNSEKVKAANKLLRIRNKKERKIIYCLYCNEQILNATEKRKYHSDCWLKCSGGYKENSTIVHRCEYNGIKFDSGLEKYFAIILDSINIKWIKNKTTYFEYEDVKQKKRKYYPDFYLPDYDFWFETKGKLYAQLDLNFEQKIKCLKNLKVVYPKDVKQIDKEIKNGNFNIINFISK